MVRLAGIADTVNRISTEVRAASLLHPSYLGKFHRKGYPKYKKTFGKSQAMKILQNEKVCDPSLPVGSDSRKNFPRL